MAFQFSSLFSCCKTSNVIVSEKHIDVSPKNATLINQIAPSSLSNSNTISNQNKPTSPNCNSIGNSYNQTEQSPNAIKKLPLRQAKSLAAIGTAIFAFNKLPMNELMEEGKDYIPKDLNILPEHVKTGPKGVITNQSGDLLNSNNNNNESLSFNALGLINQGRKIKDGVMIFGKAKQTNQMEIDYYLNIPDEALYNNLSHLFIVYYNKDKMNYIIKFNIDEQSNLAKNAYLKLLSNVEYTIKNIEYIYIEGLLFHFIPCNNGALTIIDIQKNNKRYVYKPQKCSVVTIGKDDTCTLSYPESSLSKIHIQLVYVDENWVLKNCSEPLLSTINDGWGNKIVGLNHYNVQHGTEVEIFKKRIRFDLSNKQ